MLQSEFSSQFLPYQVGKLHKMGQYKLFYCNCESKSVCCGLIWPPQLNVMFAYMAHVGLKWLKNIQQNFNDLPKQKISKMLQQVRIMF